MDVQNSIKAAISGFIDSFRGLKTIIYMDKELNQRALNRIAQSNERALRRRSSDVRESTPPARALQKHEESKVLNRFLQCCMLNCCIFLASIILFEYGFLPVINLLLQLVFGAESFMGKLVWAWVEPFLSWVFKTIWVLPLFLLSKLVNSLWFQDIADSAFRYTRGRPQFTHSVSKFISDTLFSFIVQILFLFQAMLVEYIPIYWVGYVLSMVHMSLLYSLYAFEYKWFNMGWELHHRLSFLETNWPYFIGFGMPLTIMTQFSWIISACIFSTTFPVFIISANEASPVTGVCDYPIHLFTPVIKMSNYIFRRTIGSSKRSGSPATPRR